MKLALLRHWPASYSAQFVFEDTEIAQTVMNLTWSAS